MWVDVFVSNIEGDSRQKKQPASVAVAAVSAIEAGM